MQGLLSLHFVTASRISELGFDSHLHVFLEYACDPLSAYVVGNLALMH